MGGFQFCKTHPQKKNIYNNNPIKQNQLNACHKYLYRRERIPKGGVPPSHETDEEPRKHPAIFSQGLIQSLASLSSMKQTVGLARVTRATQKSIHHGNCEFFRRVSPSTLLDPQLGALGLRSERFTQSHVILQSHFFCHPEVSVAKERR